MERHPAAPRRGVQSLSRAAELDAPPAKFVHHGDQMRDRPAQTVERPDCQDVAGLQAGEQLRKTRAILAGVGCVVRHDPVGRDAGTT